MLGCGQRTPGIFCFVCVCVLICWVKLNRYRTKTLVICHLKPWSPMFAPILIPNSPPPCPTLAPITLTPNPSLTPQPGLVSTKVRLQRRCAEGVLCMRGRQEVGSRHHHRRQNTVRASLCMFTWGDVEGLVVKFSTYAYACMRTFI